MSILESRFVSFLGKSVEVSCDVSNLIKSNYGSKFEVSKGQMSRSLGTSKQDQNDHRPILQYTYERNDDGNA